VKAWKPGCLIHDVVDEYYEPIDPKGRALAAKISLTIRLAMHRAETKIKLEAAKKMLGIESWSPTDLPNCRCIVKPAEPTE
jgi:hypothetical protein